MAFLVSPGVLVVEKDFTSIIPAVATTPGGYVGAFEWGPVLDPKLMSSEDTVTQTFGRPNTDTFVDFFTAVNFLSYGNNLQLIRVVGTGAKNAVSMGTAVLIKNQQDYDSNYANGEASVGPWAAKWPGKKGNSLKVVAFDAMGSTAAYNAATYDGTNLISNFFVRPSTSQSVTDRTNLTTANDEMHLVVLDSLGEWTGTINAVLETFGFVSKASDAKKADGTSNYYKDVMNSQSKYIWWMDDLDTSQGIQTITVTGGTGYHPAQTTVVITGDGTGASATVSFATGVPQAITITNYGTGYTTAAATLLDTNGAPGTGAVLAVTVFENVQPAGASAALGSLTNTITSSNTFKFINNTSPSNGQSYSLQGGVSTEDAVTDGQRELGWDIFKNADIYDISLMPLGGCSTILGEYVIQNVAERRKDCVAFVSPLMSDVVNNLGNEVADIVTTRDAYASSSYAVMDSGWKKQYDKYNDTFRWIPLNGDIAGLCAQTDLTNDPWWSPGGFNRGIVKNVVKLAFSPNQTERDDLYLAGVNPVTTFRGNGTVLFGDKTMQSKPSAFDRINVRRLFIVLEKSISTAAKYQLFEFNDAFTQAMFRNMVEPFLRDVQGRRGITDFEVVCDSTNNTPQIVDSNQFVADIYIKPARSINFITLNFIATATGVAFTVVGG